MIVILQKWCRVGDTDDDRDDDRDGDKDDDTNDDTNDDRDDEDMQVWGQGYPSSAGSTSSQVISRCIVIVIS